MQEPEADPNPTGKEGVVQGGSQSVALAEEKQCGVFHLSTKSIVVVQTKLGARVVLRHNEAQVSPDYNNPTSCP